MEILDSNQIHVRKGDYIHLLFFLPLPLEGMFYLLEDHVEWLLSRSVVNFSQSRYLGWVLFTRLIPLFLDKLAKVAMPDNLFNFIFQGIAVLSVMSLISMKMATFTFVTGGRRRLHRWRPSKKSFSFIFHEDVYPWSEEKSVVRVLWLSQL